MPIFNIKLSTWWYCNDKILSIIFSRKYFLQESLFTLTYGLRTYQRYIQNVLTVVRSTKNDIFRVKVIDFMGSRLRFFFLKGFGGRHTKTQQNERPFWTSWHFCSTHSQNFLLSKLTQFYVYTTCRSEKYWLNKISKSTTLRESLSMCCDVTITKIIDLFFYTKEDYHCKK